MLRSDLVTGEVLNHLLGHVAERNHAHGLPHTQTDTRGLPLTRAATVQGGGVTSCSC